MGHSSSTFATAIAIAEEHECFEVHAAGSPLFVLTDFGLPVNVLQVAPCARVVWFRSRLLPGHRNILCPFQRVLFVDADAIFATTVLTETPGRADVELAT